MLTPSLQGDGNVAPLRGGVEWAARKPGDHFRLSLVLTANETTDYIYEIECRTVQARCEVTAEKLDRKRYRIGKKGIRVGSPSPVSLLRTDPIIDENSPTIVARLYNEKSGTRRQMNRTNSALFQLVGQKLRQEIQEGVDSLIAALRNIFILDPIPSHMRTFSPLSDRLEADAGNIAGVLAALSPKEQKGIEDTLTRYASQLPERDIARVWAEPVGKFGSDAMLYSDEEMGQRGQHNVVDARGMSDGTLRFLAILTALLTRPENSLLVVEEVDNGLHPSRSKLLLQMLGEQGDARHVDVIVTTHNPALLDAMGTAIVPFITVAHRDPSSGVSRLTLLEDVKQLPKMLAQGPVGRISSQGLIERALKNQLELDL